MMHETVKELSKLTARRTRLQSQYVKLTEKIEHVEQAIREHALKLTTPPIVPPNGKA